MRHSKTVQTGLIAAGVLACISLALAQGNDEGGHNQQSNAYSGFEPEQHQLGPYRLVTIIPIPSSDNITGGADIFWADSSGGRIYGADHHTPTANTGQVDVIDAVHDNYLFSIDDFANIPPGLDHSGPAGVLVIDQRSGPPRPANAPPCGQGPRQALFQLWAGSGDGTVKVADLCGAGPTTVPFSIATGGTDRADELAYDPIDHIVMIQNDIDTPPFVTFISVHHNIADDVVLGHIFYPQAVFDTATDKECTPTASTPSTCANAGLEQPVFDSRTGRFYMSVPGTVANPNGEVDEIDPRSMMITRVFGIPATTPCPAVPAGTGPAGLALLPEQRLITSCGVVFDIRTGKMLTAITGSYGTPKGDEIWYNPGDNRVYFGLNPVIVVDATTYQEVAEIPVVVPPGTTGIRLQLATHNLTVDCASNQIFIPVTNEGVEVYTDEPVGAPLPGRARCEPMHGRPGLF